MGAFKIGERFKNLQEYDEYPYTHLFFHNTLIGKAITDNWQHRKLVNDLKMGWLKKAELNDGYAVYEVKFTMLDRRCHNEFIWSYVLTGVCESDVIRRAVRRFSKDINETVELTKEFLISTDSLTGTLSVVKKQNI